MYTRSWLLGYGPALNLNETDHDLDSQNANAMASKVVILMNNDN